MAAGGDAQALKEEGNKLFQAGEYLKSAAVYTQAIKLDPENAVLYSDISRASAVLSMEHAAPPMPRSNRSAALLKLKKVTKATEDADKCIQLRPEWEKGYFRKGAILEDQGNLAEALALYQAALKLVPESGELAQKIRTLTKLVKRSGGGAAPEPAAADKKATAPASQSTAAAQEAQAAASGAVVYEDLGDEDVAQFTEESLTLLASDIREHGTNFEPMVHFLPGPNSSVESEGMQHVQGLGAFESPETLHGFIDFLRHSAQQLDARAAMTLVPKAKIGYPQVWLRPKWPCSSMEGILAQLESRKVKKLWFIPVSNNAPGTPQSLPADDFSVLPPVLRT